MSSNDWKELTSGIKPLKNKKATIKKPERDIIIHQREVFIKENHNKKEIPLLKKNEFKRISSGYYKIDMRLDMHGMFLDDAESYFISSIKKAYERGLKRILVVTGKGTIDSPSLIKQNIPIWIKNNTILNIVSGFSEAGIEDGGSGAYYITIKTRT